MKGIIMAGGEGTRLRPLTCDCPKPMIRLMDRPVMRFAIELLRRHGICEIAATLGYLPDAVTDAFGDGAELGVSLRYYVESSPLGTAGGVRQARDFLDDTFIVLSGDGVTDLDITRAAEFHRARHAAATLVLKHADDPLEYGVVDLDPDGRVRGFHEKPDWCDITCDTVNTGIYILEPEVLDRVPEGRACDFGHELFPKLLREGLPVYGYVTQDYWCDIGDIRAYLGAHIDAMEGRIRLDGLFPLPGRAVAMPGARVDRSAVLEGPCLIAPGAHVKAGARVGPYSVIGPDCVVGSGASVKRSILWPGARLEANAQARGCVLGAGAVLEAGAQAYEESVLGTGAQAGPRCVLMPGVKLWPGKRGEAGERLDQNLVWGGRREPDFSGGCIATPSPSEAARAAQACAVVLKPREVMLGRDGTPMSEALWHATAAGLMALGIQVMDAGICTVPMLRHAQLGACADAAMLVSERAITPFNALGVPPERPDRRAIAAANARQDVRPPVLECVRPALCGQCVRAAYVAARAAMFEASPAAAPPCVLSCESAALLEIARDAFERAGLVARVAQTDVDTLPGPGEIGVALDADGEGCMLSDESGALSEAQRQLMIAWTALEAGEDTLIVPANATRAVETLAVDRGAKVEYVAGARSKWLNALARRAPRQLALQDDGLALAICTISALTARGMTLAQWRDAMPEVHRRTRTVGLPQGRSQRALDAFARSHPNAHADGGLRLERDGGWAWIGAEEGSPRLRVIAEGPDAEFARELCDFCESALRKIDAGQT